jgi:hypothetical protein
MRWNNILTSVAFSLAVISATAVAVNAAEDNTKAQASVKKAVEEGIKLLEAKDYATFLKKFVKPDDLDKILKQMPSFEKFAEMYGKNKADDMLRIFKHIKDATPTFGDDGKQATYSFEFPGISKKAITFKKVEDRWCVENR